MPRDQLKVADALATVAGPGLPATADAVAVTHHTSGNVLIAGIEDNTDHYQFVVPEGEVGLLDRGSPW
jgi:hypothetical protein